MWLVLITTSKCARSYRPRKQFKVCTQHREEMRIVRTSRVVLQKQPTTTCSTFKNLRKSYKMSLVPLRLGSLHPHDLHKHDL